MAPHDKDKGENVIQPDIPKWKRDLKPQIDEDGVSEHPTHVELDAKLGRVSAETDTKIARIEGKLDLVLSKMDESLDASRSTKANQWVIGTALAVLMVALAFGIPAVFGNGLQLRDVIHSEVQDTLAKKP